MKRALPSLAVAAVFGCALASGCSAATTAFTRTGPTLPAQPGNCEFTVAKAAPADPSTELGTVEIKYVSQTDWIYDEADFTRKVRGHVCQSGGDTVVPRINDNGLYVSGAVYTTKAAPAAPEAAPPAPPEPEAVQDVPAPAATAPAPASAPDKSAQAAAKPEKKDDEPAKAVSGKKGTKKGASAKKDEDIRGKDGKIDIDKLL
jgi:hypothetical protein